MLKNKWNDGFQIVWKWPYNSYQIDGQQQLFSKIIPDVFLGIVLTRT